MPRNSPSPRCRAILLAATLLPLALSIASCGRPPVVVKPIEVNRELPGRDLTDCPEETPPATFPFPDEVARYTWANGAISEGRECRERLRKAKVWMLNPPKADGPK